MWEISLRHTEWNYVYQHFIGWKVWVYRICDLQFTYRANKDHFSSQISLSQRFHRPMLNKNKIFEF